MQCVLHGAQRAFGWLDEGAFDVTFSCVERGIKGWCVMGNIIIRSSGKELPRVSPEAEPIQWMRWDPFREMAPFWAGEDQVPRFTPDFDVRETREGFVFRADVPGVKDRDLEITMTGNRLTITGKREAAELEQTDTYYARERSYGSFTRAFTLPDGTDTGDHVHADLREGVLTLVLPKKQELKPRRIEVKGSEPPPSQ
jgi:HSP20 family protein